MEKPTEGGSYIRQKDGALKRADELKAAPPAVTQPESKPAARTPRAATTKDK
ncbi:MAG: hypothetical protein ACRC9K_12185 [Afipia sp.]